MISPYDSVVVRIASRLLIPYMQLFGLYVLFHGHDSPGGGFQAGAILGASVILTRFTQGGAEVTRFLHNGAAVRLGGIGVLVYALVGLMPVAWGFPFLDYSALPVPGLVAAELRHLGILAVEAGVAAGVCGVMVSIFDDLAPAEVSR